jgi:hypothetical protein
MLDYCGIVPDPENIASLKTGLVATGSSARDTANGVRK